MKREQSPYLLEIHVKIHIYKNMFSEICLKIIFNWGEEDDTYWPKVSIY